MKTCVIVPTLNEEEVIKKLLTNIPNPVANKIVVVDGYSSDSTVDIVKEFQKKLDIDIIFQEGKGKGMAFRSFINRFDLDDYDNYVMLDADYTYDPAEMKKMLFPLFNGIDVVMGDRLSNNHLNGSMTFTNYMGNKFLSFIASFLYTKPTKDVCTGYWAFKRKFLKNVDIKAKGFDLEVNLFSEAVKKGFRIQAIPINYGKRLGTKKLKVSHGFSILWRLLKERFL